MVTWAMHRKCYSASTTAQCVTFHDRLQVQPYLQVPLQQPAMLLQLGLELLLVRNALMHHDHERKLNRKHQLLVLRGYTQSRDPS